MQLNNIKGKDYLTYLLLAVAIALMLYLVMESRQRSRQIDKTLKEIPATTNQ